MKPKKMRWLIGVLVALAMVAAACGGNDDDDADAPAPAPATEAPAAAEPEPEPEAPEPEAEEAAPAEPEPEPEEAPEEEEPEFQPAPTEEPEPEIPLTATWRGVTADTITIGVTYLDADLLVELGFSPATWGDQDLQIQALVDDINDRGGINGRQLVALTDKYNPIGATEAEAACLRLTEDNEVFAILFGFLGPAEVANTCIVSTQETVLVGGTITPERLADARAPWVNERVTREVSTGALFTLLNEEGMLEGRSIAVVADLSAAPQLESVANLLRDRGVEPVLEVATSSQVADLVAQNQEWATLSERIRASGADTLLLVGNASAGVENARLNGLEVDIWATDASGLGSNIGSNVNPESARGVITVGAMTNAQIFETDPRFKECLDAFNARHPDIEVKHPDTLDPEEPRWFTALAAHCRFFQLFELLATAAGPNLTHETFAEAIATIGEFSIAGQPYASLGPDKLSSNDSFQLLEQDPDLGARGELVPAGPMRDATP
ncbi:MAG: ABC transporter substrate-binding protein [Acidimicrobiia bacterium]|nr:ABC transporter substrate-binding protein [Acidimicrobiia bacterium]MYE73297.1 ABC transporter substrate-binding protein [Acidimicrobiia bacterium]MYJ63037.1 ABC transporter substrate-binding protein [Acidimicrobiia bacterium]